MAKNTTIIIMTMILSMLLVACDGKSRSRYVASCSAQGIPKELCSCSYKELKGKFSTKQIDDYVRGEKLPDREWNGALVDTLESCGVGKEAAFVVRRALGLDLPVDLPNPSLATPPAMQQQESQLPLQEPEFSQCGKDTDCKGDRICESGQCIAPYSAGSMQSPVEPAYTSLSTDATTCTNAERLIFSCTTTNQKQVALCDSGSELRYIFARRTQKPEMNLSVLHSMVSVARTSSMETVRIPTGNTVYSIFDQTSESGAREAGVNVEINGRHAATVQCEPSSVTNLIDNLRP
ncbi:hypothetical protein I5U31_01165 [Stenotrophomonas maltophilia]|uniref:hypothetical protein n=1 Tax=Stenotrophomonas TaxID=40323 RepID=UPI000951404C|nr:MULTISPECIES: hypothetical protein [Stenotrophomonas]MBH1425610.1 hypothetical protein [Stenotrophomonas maltophilia]MBH1873214.1 hypothetical protein [Stenotrophomonas maltophilia]